METAGSKESNTICEHCLFRVQYDSKSARPGSNLEWGPIYYETAITVHGFPEPTSFWGSTLDTRADEHKGCNWGMQVD